MSLVRSSIMMNSLTKTLSRRDTSFESTSCLSRTWCGIWYDSLLYQRAFCLSTLICKTKVSNSHIVLDHTSSLTEMTKRKYGRWAVELRVRETRRRVKQIQAPGDNKCHKYKNKRQTRLRLRLRLRYSYYLPYYYNVDAAHRLSRSAK